MDTDLELHCNSDESFSGDEPDEHLLDLDDSEMEGVAYPTLQPKKTFVPRNRIMAPDNCRPRKERSSPYTPAPHYAPTPGRTPAQLRLGPRRTSTVNGYGNTLAHTNFTQNEKKYTIKRTLLPAPTPTRHTSTSNTPSQYTQSHYTRTTPTQNTNTQTPIIPLPGGQHTYSQATTPAFSRPPPQKGPIAMTEYILTDLTRSVVDKARRKYNIRLNEAFIQQAITSGQM